MENFKVGFKYGVQLVIKYVGIINFIVGLILDLVL